MQPPQLFNKCFKVFNKKHELYDKPSKVFNKSVEIDDNPYFVNIKLPKWAEGLIEW